MSVRNWISIGAVGAIAGFGLWGLAGNQRADYFQYRNLFAAQLGIPKNKFVLTFDDGPGVSTMKLAQFLAAYKMPATFFVVNNSVNARPKTTREIFEFMKDYPELFIVANHTATHANLSSASITQAEKDREFLLTHDKVIGPFYEGTTDYYFFRAPYGNFRPSVAASYNQKEPGRDYVGPIHWDIGGYNAVPQDPTTYTGDWTCWSKGISIDTCRAGLLREIKSYVSATPRKSGIIFLAHDFHAKTVEMFVGASTLDAHGNLKYEDPNSLLAQLRKMENDASGKQDAFQVVPLDYDREQILRLRDTDPAE